MTEPSIGISSLLAAHRERCEAFIELLADDPNALGAMVSLRQRLGDELAGIVFDAASLQSEARKKLSPPGCPIRPLWVTGRSLQQATPWQVARLKGSWFGGSSVHDLCCGIGGDSVQLAGRGAVTAVDLDPLMAAMTAANLQNAGHCASTARAVCGDVTAMKRPAASAIHIDPDRRGNHGRHSEPNLFQPAWPLVSQMIRDTSAAVIKLAPASTIPDGGLPATEFHRCWISLSGSVREQSLLWGAALDRSTRHRGTSSAVVLRGDGTATWFDPGASVNRALSVDAIPTDRVPTMLVDPNSAIRAAGLTASFAEHYGLEFLNGPSGFLASRIDTEQLDSQARSLSATGAVQWWGACDDRKLRKEFRARNVYPETIKVRGTDHDPNVLVKKYRRCGDQPVTLWIGRHGKRVFAAITLRT